MIFIFFGPPGAGKGTQAQMLSKKLKLAHLSTGEILRKKLFDTDSLSTELQKIIDSGNLVSDDILNKIVADRLSYFDCKSGFILDGYPRTLVQKDFLNKYLVANKLSITNIFDLKIDKQIIIERIKSRLIKENRHDDKEEIIKTRISKYLQETKPLSDFYTTKYPNNYHFVNGNQEIEMIQEDILKIIKK